MKRSIFSLLGVLLLASACQKMNPDEERTVLYYANTFAYNVMNTYYLWKDDVSSRLKGWSTKEDPFKRVEDCRYEMDRWTKLYEDYSSFESISTGNGETFGLDFSMYYYDEAHTQICAVINYTYEKSPARLAGLQRGDAILSIDGVSMTPDNYKTVGAKLIQDGSITLGMDDGRTLYLQSRKMYENPVQTSTTLDYGGKRFGYLHYTNFTMDSCKDLETVFAGFKADGITDLVLDLRYNSGGYVITSVTLASMIAPLDAVENRSIYNKNVYNDLLTQSDEDVERFEKEVTYPSSSGQDVTVHPLKVNPGIEHLWVLTSGQTASASEALICGLKPYMDVTLIGKQTSGKFTGGVLVKATNWFDSLKDASFDIEVGKKALPTWGLYVITSRYSDCNGVTLSMPDGISPDYEVSDNPADPAPLGSPQEKMLAAALSIATGGPVPASVKSVSAQAMPEPIRKPGFGVLIH